MPLNSLAADAEHGAAVDVVDVLSWTFNETCSTSRRGTSDSAGSKKTFAGTRMASGEIRCLFDQSVSAPALKPGDSNSLKLITDGNDYNTVPVIITSRALTVDLDEGTVIEETLGWESNGAWVETRAGS